jgi:hypothetical protein
VVHRSLLASHNLFLAGDTCHPLDVVRHSSD